MRLAVYGSGCVGLVNAACFADCGHEVVCIDPDAERIGRLSKGDVPLFEPDLSQIVQRNLRDGRLRFTTGEPSAVADAELHLIAVGTNDPQGDGRVDLQPLYAAASLIAEHAGGPAFVAVKSTVPVGTGEAMELHFASLRGGRDVAVISCPEFLREGHAVSDFLHPDRVVVGADDPRGQAIMADLFRPLPHHGRVVLQTSRRTAEMVKYAANAFLAVKVGFINEIADLCEKVGSDVEDVARGIGLDRRIGPAFLQPGPGYGGSCLPKDMRALARIGAENGARMSIVEAANTANRRRILGMADRIEAVCDGSLTGRRLAVLGLTFKADTDDTRSSPAVTIANCLVERGADLRAYDPKAEPRSLSPGITFCGDPYAAADGADLLLVMTEWDEFRSLDFDRLAKLMARRLVVDFRNLFHPRELADRGFRYVSIGRPVEAPTV